MTKQERIEANARNFPFDYTTDEIRQMYDPSFVAEYDARNFGDRHWPGGPLNSERRGLYDWALEIGAIVEADGSYKMRSPEFDEWWGKIRAIRTVREREGFGKTKNENLMRGFLESRGNVGKEMSHEAGTEDLS